MRVFLIYSLSLIVCHSVLGMQLTKMPLGMKKKFVRSVINKSVELDAMRQKWDNARNSPQDVVKISEGKIVIKEEIPLGKRYGTCHNYAFTKLMGIVGKTPRFWNITGNIDYYEGCTQVTNFENVESGISITEFFEPLVGDTIPQPGDIIVYVSDEKEQDLLHRITHTGLFIGTDCVESKWGALSAVFEHPLWYVPACFGKQVIYARLKMNGTDLFEAVQKRLHNTSVKENYEKNAHYNQQKLFDKIKHYEQDRLADNIYYIYRHLERNMNIHLDVPDENGLTPLMHAEKIGCEKLKGLFAAYKEYSE